MRILSIDPGTTESAFVLSDDFTGGNVLLEHGKILNDGMRNVIIDSSDPKLDYVVIEMIQCYGMAVGREVFQTVFWTGRFAECADRINVNVILLARTTIKSYVTGMSKSKDKHVRQALMLKYGGTKKGEPLHGISGDMWSALAVMDYVRAGLKNKDLKEW